MDALNKSIVAREIEKLYGWRAVAFALSCARRMLANYINFSVETGFGDPSVLASALDVVWQYLEEGEVDSDIEGLMEKCDRQAPNSEKYSSRLTSAAIDAANAVSILLTMVSDQSASAASDVAQLAYDTVDMYVQDSLSFVQYTPEIESQIAESLLVRRELEVQWLEINEISESADRLSWVNIARRQAMSGSLSE